MIGMLYWEYYLLGIILLPGIILGIIAQAKVNNAYSTYSRVYAKSGRSASDVARLLLDTAGLQDIKITKANGEMSDYYDPTKKVVALSAPDSTSVAALSIAAHEVGHALQYKTKYAPIYLRTAAIKLTNFSSKMLLPLIIISLLLNFLIFPTSAFGTILMWITVGLYGLSTLVSLITLPVEFNASKRAKAILQQTGILQDEENQYAKTMLDAAALTYVAALLISILSLLRILIVVLRANNRD